MSDHAPPAAPATITVTAPAPAPVEPPQPDHGEQLGELRGRLEGFETRLETIAQEARTWTQSQILAAITRLDNLEATATTGLSNLAEQITQVRQELKDLLTLQSQEEPLALEVIPPEVPPAPPQEAGAGIPTGAGAPAVSQNGQSPGQPEADQQRISRAKRVI